MWVAHAIWPRIYGANPALLKGLPTPSRARLLCLSFAIFIGMGFMGFSDLQAAEPLPRAEESQPISAPRETAMENSRMGDIQNGGEGYRGNFGWFGTDKQEIEAGEEPASPPCSDPNDGLAARLWDGNGACISGSNKITPPATSKERAEKEGSP